MNTIVGKLISCDGETENKSCNNACAEYELDENGWKEINGKILCPDCFKKSK